MAKVYFCDLHTTREENLLKKMKRLVRAAGLETLDMQHRFVAIKTHFGEPGNLGHLRPQFARALADLVKENGGKPYLVDCNTLYPGRRKNALEHLEAAFENGFNPFTLGCHLLIGDGLKGDDEVCVPVHGDYVEAAKIGRGVMDADVFISLTHIKMSISSGLGGVIKNIGMGCGSRAGKMEMHAEGKPRVDAAKCRGCGKCSQSCAHDALHYKHKKAVIDEDRCLGCGRCLSMCAFDAISVAFTAAHDILCAKMAEYTAAVVRNIPSFHVAVVMDVNPNCDCMPANDPPVVPDVGILASFDPVALDLACAELINAQPLISRLGMEARPEAGDYFQQMYPDTHWRVMIEQGEKMGIGSTDYELVKI